MSAQSPLEPIKPGRFDIGLDHWLARFGRLPGPVRTLLGGLIILLAGLMLLGTISAPLDLPSQCFFAVLCAVTAFVIRKLPGRLPVLALIVLSLIASLRYMYWRLTSTLDFETWTSAIFGYGLVAAEIYALVVLLFGYVQTAWPLQRRVHLMPGEPDTWPTVDVFIPTYNEALPIVKLTVFAAQAMDWPQDKLRVHLLDDGHRDNFREFCESIGVNYLTRDNNRHAKAGNLNAALAVTDGEYIAMFDADHVPTRSFLQVGMGWFLRDPKLALLQTPHYFFSPDPFEKNLHTFRAVPNEGELFYGLVQDGNDLWNATFFCGSCAIMRRSSLEEVGGVATDTVTEDAHTALNLNRAGYNTAYLAIPQAAGLATESLSRHISQRIRWARGMAQIFRTDNPLLGKGLNLGQRICYANAMLHFFYGLPRLVFLTAPLAYLLFGAEIFHASALMIAAYVLPHLFHSNLANSTIQGRFRHSFWNEVYETVLAWYIMPPVLMALINPKFGGFNVTDKGGIIDHQYFDWKMARPYVILLAANLIGLGFGIHQLVFGDADTTTTVLINLAWTLYNLVITSAAVAVASESRQVRAEPRVRASLNVTMSVDGGEPFLARTLDFSTRGLGLQLPEGMNIEHGKVVRISLARNERRTDFDANVVFSRGNLLGARFMDLDLRQQSDLVRMTFSRADTWAQTWGSSRPDTPLAALRDVTRIGLGGMGSLLAASLDLGRQRLAKTRQSTSTDPLPEQP